MIPIMNLVAGWSKSAAAETVPLTWNEALSGILGSVSLACWIFVLAPQLWENYRAKSAAGLSVAFLVVWFIGDVTNFVGAVLAGLVPTVIAVAIWYIFSDAALLGQTMYYNHLNKQKERQELSTDPEIAGTAAGAPQADENAPLLRRSSTDVPGSRRHSSQVTGDAALASVSEIDASSASPARQAMTNLGAVLAICVVGTAAWAIAYGVGAWKPTPAPIQGGDPDSGDDTVALVLGYISAVCYLGARIPQIVKNFRCKSCEGLSLLFFILSMMGNLTYGAQILFHSLDRRYILTNLPWLIGSIGTISEDLTIFVQFRLYRTKVATE